MKFNELLTEYMNSAGLSVRDLAGKCGVSDATISRYRSGARVPDADDEIVSCMSEVLAGLLDKTYEEVLESFRSALPDTCIDREAYRAGLNTLIEGLDISLSAFAKSANYDPSFVSRICSGTRFPSDYRVFADRFATYVSRLCRNADKFLELSKILHVSGNYSGAVKESVYHYLMDCGRVAGGEEDGRSESSMHDFLHELDSFNLEDYIAKIHYDKLKVPSLHVHLPITRKYFGAEGMKDAELDFVRSVALLPEPTDVYMYSTLPIEELTADMSFANKYLIGMAAMLKKGHTLHVIHDLNRPYDEFMEGLIGWIPLYMTGQIVPYYIPDDYGMYKRLMRITDSISLWGECVGEEVKNASFYMTQNKNEIALYRDRSRQIFDTADSLMDIYTENRERDFELIYGKELRAGNYTTINGDKGPFKNICMDIDPDRCVIITKSLSPHIHFVIHHPILVNGIGRLFGI